MNTLTLPPLDLDAIVKMKQIARDAWKRARATQVVPMCPICRGYAGNAWGAPQNVTGTAAEEANFESHLDNRRECVVGRFAFWAELNGWEPIEKQIWLDAIGNAQIPLSPVPVHQPMQRDDPAYGRTADYVYIPGWVAHMIRDHESGQIADLTPTELMHAIMSEMHKS